MFFIGLQAQTETTPTQQSTVANLQAAAAAGLLGPMSVQNLLTLAAMSQPSLAGTTATTTTNQPTINGSSTATSNPASLCKISNLFTFTTIEKLYE